MGWTWWWIWWKNESQILKKKNDVRPKMWQRRKTEGEEEEEAGLVRWKWETGRKRGRQRLFLNPPSSSSSSASKKKSFFVPCSRDKVVSTNSLSFLSTSHPSFSFELIAQDHLHFPIKGGSWFFFSREKNIKIFFQKKGGFISAQGKWREEKEKLPQCLEPIPLSLPFFFCWPFSSPWNFNIIIFSVLTQAEEKEEGSKH